MTYKIGVVCFRKDLRIHDNPALHNAIEECEFVAPLYIFYHTHDAQTITAYSIGQAQKWWLYHSLRALNIQLKNKGLLLNLVQGNPEAVLEELVMHHPIGCVYWNKCYDKHGINLDSKVRNALLKRNVVVKESNASLLCEPNRLENQLGSHFKIYTPFSRKLRQEEIASVLPQTLGVKQIKPVILSLPTQLHTVSKEQLEYFAQNTEQQLDTWNLLPTKPNWAVPFHNYWRPGEDGGLQKLEEFIACNLNQYHTQRDFASCNATSQLSAHIHFGEVSVRMIWHMIHDLKWRINTQHHTKQNLQYNLQSLETFLAQLAWREFSYHTLYHCPHALHQNLRQEFDAFPWNTNNDWLRSWQKGQTGYPIVDAGMRQLWNTGYMHNRVRMIVASFLTKTLIIDWRVGAKWFLNTLLDADLPNNSISWQWVSGSGTDAAPYFRIFNPTLQSEKFDANGDYIKQWVPELRNLDSKSIHQPYKKSTRNNPHLESLDCSYTKPIVDHATQRLTALKLYSGLKK